MGSIWKLTLIERLSYWTSYAFHMYKSCHQICNECMGSRHHTDSLVSMTVRNGNHAVATSSISCAAILLANSTTALILVEAGRQIVLRKHVLCIS